MKEALLIIDVQEGFFADAENPVFKEAPLIENINKLIGKFRKNNNPIIFIRHTEEDGEELEKNSKKWQIYSKIDTKKLDFFIDKTTPDSFLDTDLFHTLKENEVSTIVIAGLQTDYCIDTTCRSAFGKKINIILASDAHSTYDNSFMKANKIIAYHNRIIGRWFATLKSTREIIINTPAINNQKTKS